MILMLHHQGPKAFNNISDRASGMLIYISGQEALVYEQVKINNEESRWFPGYAKYICLNSGELLVINDGVRM